MPELGGGDALVKEGWDVAVNPPYRRHGCWIVGGELFVKFAWSTEAAGPVAREGRVLMLLADAGLPVPQVVACHPEVACFVSRRVPGGPVTAAGLGSLTDRELKRFADQLVAALVTLRSPQLRADLAGLADPGPPRAQADVDELRADLGPMIHADQRAPVLELLDRVEAVLADAGPEPVILHGDLHGYNMVWDGRNLAAICDFETLTLGDPSFDIRYLPDNAPTQAYFNAVLDGLKLAGQDDDRERSLAWHTLTRLGDARWRTLAGVALPGGGTPAQWVDGLFGTLAEHGALLP